MTDSINPSDLELQILSALWRLEPIAVKDLLHELPDGKPRAYTTVLSSLQLMEKKGLVTRQRKGKADFWSSAVSQDDVLSKEIKTLVNHGFAGKPSSLLQCLLDSEIESGELDTIYELLEEFRDKQPNKK